MASARTKLTWATSLFLLAMPLAGEQSLREPAEEPASSRAALAEPGSLDVVGSDRSTHKEASYLLGPDDEVTVSVLEAEEISGQPIRIGSSGYINVPMVGRVRAAGLTVDQLEGELTERLKVYMHEPRVAVSVSQFRSQPVSVIGRVNQPGIHQLEGRKTLVEILSLAGGLADDAGHSVKITRRLEQGSIPLRTAKLDPTGQFTVAEVDVKAVMEAKSPEDNVIIQPHDVISVPRARMVYVIGAVGQAGGYVLNERENVSVLQALALAHGLDAEAAPKSAKILRPVGEGSDREEIAVDLKSIMASKSPDVPLQEEDILFVPKSGGKAALKRATEAAISLGTGILIWRR